MLLKNNRSTELESNPGKILATATIKGLEELWDAVEDRATLSFEELVVIPFTMIK